MDPVSLSAVTTLAAALLMGLLIARAWEHRRRLALSAAIGLLLGPVAYVVVGMTARHLPSLRSPRFYSFPFSELTRGGVVLFANLTVWSFSCGALAYWLSGRWFK
jgi:hypothetical protein